MFRVLAVCLMLVLSPTEGFGVERKPQKQAKRER